MTTFEIPNRPIGTQKRNVNQLISNFDAILNTLVSGLEADNMNGGVMTAAKFQAEAGQRFGLQGGYSEVTTSEGTTSNTPVDLATRGPAVTITVAKLALVICSFGSDRVGLGSGRLFVDPYPGLGDPNYTTLVSVGGIQDSAILVMPGTYEFCMKYSAVSGTATYSNRRLRIQAFSNDSFPA